MRLFRVVASAGRLACLLAAWTALLPLLAAAADESVAKVARTEFKHEPSTISYFEDSNIILMFVEEAGILRISEDGGDHWGFVDKVNADEDIVGLVMHRHDKHSAIAIGKGKKHFATFDRAKTWVEFETKGRINPMTDSGSISWHATDPKKIIVQTMRPPMERDYESESTAYYTTDGFDSGLKPLMDSTSRCSWAKLQPEFDPENKVVGEKRTFCIVPSSTNFRKDDFRLVYSDNFFDKGRKEVLLDGDRPLSGIASMVATTRFLLVARKPEGTNELTLYTSNGGERWARTLFTQQKLESEGYTVLESTNHSIRVNVLLNGNQQSNKNNYGRLFQSNSEGNFFSLSNDDIYTNIGPRGFVDFEKVTNVEGVLLINAVDNVEAVSERGAEKVIISKISFDDGRSYQNLVLVDNDGKKQDEKLHLHSVTDITNTGRVFSSPAPGLLMGVGNTGKSLREWDECDTFVSDDSGETWKLAIEGPHLYEFGDSGSVLVAVNGKGSTNKISYSFHHGPDGDWKDMVLPVGKGFEKFKPILLTTMPDNTGRRFLLQAREGTGNKIQNVVYTIDFGVPEKPKCKDSDFEQWAARVDPDTKKPTCVMGHTQVFKRRKADANCFVSDLFNEPLPDQSEVCECTIKDYECDYGFLRDKEDRSKCVPTADFKPFPSQCDNGQEEFLGASGYRLIPGNTCKGGEKLDEHRHWKCSEVGKRPVVDGEIRVEETEFPYKNTESFSEYYYLEASPSDDTEVIMMTTRPSQQLYTTTDHGNEWIARSKDLDDLEVLSIIRNQFETNHAYFTTPSKKVFYTKDRTQTIKSFEAPVLPLGVPRGPLRFHEKNSNWLIWLGCKSAKSAERTSRGLCEPVSYYSTSGGDEWHPLLRGVQDCEFVYRKDRPGPQSDQKQVYCAAFEGENTSKNMQLVSSADFFETSQVLYDDIVSFATMSEFILVAKREEQFLSLEASANGKEFAEAKFPHGFDVEHHTAFTVLDSSTHSIFLHVTTNAEDDRNYGTILKSNSNGTYYVKVLDNVNRNNQGYVDFEKMLSIEGISLVNQISNPDEVDKGASKKLRTLISHNDGGQWDYLVPPSKDSDGTDYTCDGRPVISSRSPECSLNLHAYTERTDFRDSLSSPSAVGVMLAVGNVGSSLESKKDGDTFISSDGGLTWKTAMKGQYQWEFGDQGAIIALVSEGEPTNRIYYSLDRGETWTEKEFTERKVLVSDITTIPSDGSRKFILWTLKNGMPTTYSIDFAGLLDKRCKLPNEDLSLHDSDYEEFVPRHPKQDNDCLFGHKSIYYRKKNDAKCYNGNRIEQPLDAVQEKCACTRQDFECDYNYERNEQSQQCVKISGLPDPDPQAVCKQDGRIEYYSPTGYRKIPLDTCEGGRDLEKYLGTSKPCPGKEDEWKEKHRGLSGVGLFFAIVLPILAAGGIGYFVWRNYGSELGRIRLGEPSSPGSTSTSNRLIAWPIAIVSALAAAAMTIPVVLGSVVRGIRERVGSRSGGRFGGRYTSRSSFARGRGPYSAVGNEELESDLLGDESDEE